MALADHGLEYLVHSLFQSNLRAKEIFEQSVIPSPAFFVFFLSVPSGVGCDWWFGTQMATDDLVLLLVWCFLDAAGGDKTHGDEQHTFVTDLAFIKAFHFCEDSASAVYFVLSTFEVL